ncbi:MAG: hypothetical protein LBD91_00400 [Prevotellaceae bacterium]|jgi:uncharacterized protein (TIGR02145 family)|nr:hypothetical protein [Prevotellaceae bacterium]
MKISTPFRFPFHIWGIIALCGGLSSACSEEETTYSYSTYSSYISGALNTNAHDYRVKGTTVLLSANGITSPDQHQVSFKWTITGTEEQTLWGQAVRYQCPNTGSSFTLALAASAYDSYGLSASKTVTLIDDTFAATVRDITAGASFTDSRDGQTYQYQTIGSFDWMTQNLNWHGAGKEYKNESEYSIIFGRYYSWTEAMNVILPVCPSGWRLPTNADWEDLGAALNGGQAMSFAAHWRNVGSRASVDAKINDRRLWPYDPNNTKQNTHGWNALPAGKIAGNDSPSDNGRYGYWWSADEFNNTNAFYRYIVYNNDLCYYNYGDKEGLYLSVRCVR